MKNETILQTSKLQKYFGSVHAVEEVSLTVRRGEIYGFLGPNGAGKTTTIGMLLGLIRPTAGSVTLFGQPVTPANTSPLRRVGSLVGGPALIPYLSARQNLELIARLYPNIKNKQIDETMEMVGLQEAAQRKAGQFSTGMKQRLGLAMALLNQPELLILDEPTNGMDPAGMREMRVLLRDLSGKGVTVFLSSHLLHEVEQVCDRIAVLNRGRITTQGAVNELLGQQSSVKIRVPSPSEAAALLLTMQGVREVNPNGAYVTVYGVPSQEAVSFLASHNIIPSEVSNGHGDLEDLFLELIGKEN